MNQPVPDNVSFPGRVANTVTRVLAGVVNWLSRRQAATYEKSAGDRRAGSD
jgi:hypothetical protein